MEFEEQGRDWNEGHPDHEGEMAVTQLHRIVEMASELLELVGEDDELPGWVQYKVGRAYTDLSDAHGYIEAESDEGSMSVVEARKRKKKGKKKRGLWDAIHARREAGKRPKRPGEKGYPKTLDIEEAVLRRLLGRV